MPNWLIIIIILLLCAQVISSIFSLKKSSRPLRKVPLNELKPTIGKGSENIKNDNENLEKEN
jgi:hypothetical protein